MKIFIVFLVFFFGGCTKKTNNTEIKQEEASAVERGKKLTAAYGCISCHQIPGLKGHPGNVGPPLDNWSERKFIAGSVPNKPEPLAQWLLKPHSIEKNTSMPKVGLTKAEALDIAAFLYSLD